MTAGPAVKQVSSVVKDIASLAERAAKAATQLRGRIVEADQALEMVDSLSDMLGSATTELRAALGTQTNSPPDPLA